VPPLRGGAVEKMWFELGKQFSQQGHSVCQVSRSFSGLPEEEQIEGVRHVWVRGYDTPANELLDLFYSRRALRVLPPADILITNTFWSPLLAARQQQWLGRIVEDVQRMPKGQMPFYRGVACLRANSNAVAEAIAREAPHLAGLVRTIPNPLHFLPPLLAAARGWTLRLNCCR
jgi:hypothetical protein